MFIAALFRIDQTFINSKIDNKSWCVHAKEYYIVMKMKCSHMQQHK